ncbi:hypothetical protein D1AOALGA4SA_5835 [Olavius algarvensis Delta 1 endosymbiont]|nr:hypothetical protein D1AOALGA4SA_5835 [Olavius algarvensis Delta 1 endosymbiont]
MTDVRERNAAFDELRRGKVGKPRKAQSQRVSIADWGLWNADLNE